MEDKNILSFLEEQGMINIDDVQVMMEEKRRQDIISKHEFSIFKDKDGRWKTTIRDSSKKNGKRLIAKKDRRDLEDLLIDYINESESLINNNITLRELFVPWMQSRKLEVSSINTIKRNYTDWKKYYINDDIVDIPMCQLTRQNLIDWAHKKIRDNELTKRQYNNMILIMNKCFEYAESSGYISENIWSKVKINRKLLLKDRKKTNETQIYFYEEKNKIIKYALYKFNKNNKDIVALSIPLMFLTGMRIGEIAALKYEDLVGDNIYIRRSEVADYDMLEDGSFSYVGVKVVDHAKTDAGERVIPYTNGAKRIIEMIKKSSDEFGFYDDGYIFCPNSKRIRSNTIDKRIYNFCDSININKKSAHKIRKTYISTMVSSGIDLDTIRRVSGHTDISTTFNSYTYSLNSDEENHKEFEDMCCDISNIVLNV